MCMDVCLFLQDPLVQPEVGLWPLHICIHTYILMLILKGREMEWILISK